MNNSVRIEDLAKTEIGIEIAINKENKLVFIRFEREVRCIGLSKSEAASFGKWLIESSEKV